MNGARIRARRLSCPRVRGYLVAVAIFTPPPIGSGDLLRQRYAIVSRRSTSRRRMFHWTRHVLLLRGFRPVPAFGPAFTRPATTLGQREQQTCLYNTFSVYQSFVHF